MDMKPLFKPISTALVKGESYNVLSYDEYRESKALWDTGNLAVKEGDYVLPYRGDYSNKNSNAPGIYSAGSLDFVVYPNKNDEHNYKDIPIITISSEDNIEEIIKKENVLSKLAEPWITNPDNITNIHMKESDEPSMKILKQAINEKRCDIDKYAPRFGDNFPNDKRQLKNSSVTLKIINRFCDNLDMEAILTIRDKDTGVPNPMKKPVSVSLTSGEFLNIDIIDGEPMEEESSEEDDF